MVTIGVVDLRLWQQAQNLSGGQGKGMIAFFFLLEVRSPFTTTSVGSFCFSSHYTCQLFPEIPCEERLQLAQEFWKQSNGAASIAKAARMYGLGREMLRDRIHVAASRAEAHQKMQRLSPGESPS